MDLIREKIQNIYMARPVGATPTALQELAYACEQMLDRIQSLERRVDGQAPGQSPVPIAGGFATG